MTTLGKESQIEWTKRKSLTEELHDLMQDVKNKSEHKEVKETSELWKRFESMFNALKLDWGYNSKGDFWRVQKFDNATFDTNAINHFPMDIYTVPCIEIYEEPIKWNDRKMWLWYDKEKDQFYYCPNAWVKDAFSYPLEHDEAKEKLDKFEQYIWEINSMEKSPK